MRDESDGDNAQHPAMRARRHREIIAEFGSKALQTRDLDALLYEACMRTAEGLGVERAKVLQHRPDADDLLVRAGVGWAEGVVGMSLRLTLAARISAFREVWMATIRSARIQRRF